MMKQKLYWFNHNIQPHLSGVSIAAVFRFLAFNIERYSSYHFLVTVYEIISNFPTSESIFSFNL